jgi:DNA polymerase-3 subunit epsilon
MKIQVESSDLHSLLTEFQKRFPTDCAESPAFQKLLGNLLDTPDPYPADFILGLKLTKPLITFDLETTGLDVVNDRICSLGYKIMHPMQGPDPEITKGVFYFNPGIVIPPEVEAIHGLSNERLKNELPFKEQAASMYGLFFGCDLATFNGNSFDVLLLSEEFARAGVSWPLPGTRMIDVKNIFTKKEARSLVDAHRFYLGEEMEGNHEAGADVEATFNVLKAQLARYPDLGEMTIDGLHQYCMMNPAAVDLAGKLALDDDGDYIYTFGKNKGVKVKDVPGYARWMLDADFPGNTKAWLEKILDKCCRSYM